MLHEKQLKTPNALDGKAGMSLITNKLESSLDLHHLEQFIDKNYCETRQRDRINYYNSNNLGASEEIQSSLNRSTKYGTFEHSPSNMDIDTQFDKNLCCGNGRKKSNREKRNEFLEHGLAKYLTDQIEFLREEIKAKNKIIDHLFTLRLSLRDEQKFFYKNIQINKSSNKVDNESVLHNCSPQGTCFKENSNDLNENIINIFDELNNASTLKDDFMQPCNKTFTDNNSESIIDFNVDPQFNRLTCEINDSNNFDSVKQIDGENNKVILDSNKRNDNNDNNNSIEQNNDADIPLGNSGVKRINHCNNNLIDEPIENFICSDLDVIEKPKGSLSDNIIVNNEFNCDAHIVENTDDSNGNRNDDSNENITL